ncbi:uncharacterized protein [Ptychodera flava]|uniref:uncharacterized protein n=1 Tax=Ptychodera flava TaxID=63121 RepID=UPI00396A502E
MTNGMPCNLFHHPLLHAGTDTVTAVKSENNSVGVATIYSKGTLLPVVSVNIVSNHGRQQPANVLLDSGAQISLIRTSLAESLQLRGKTVSTTITKVGGEEEELCTKIYVVPVRPVNKKQMFTVKAVGIPSISDDISEVSVIEMSKQLNIKPYDIHRGSGSVDLLIGIDHAKMHAGETIEVGNLIARHSPLGWVVFGASTEEQSQNCQVLHIKFSAPVDLTDFWTTETMGVTAKSCTCKPDDLSPAEADEARIIDESCTKVGNQWLIPYPWRKDPSLLPDNRVQAEKKLYATERRLMRNPDHAEAYSSQIKEMVEMQFARKISDEESESYRDPVHYIAHHEVLKPEKKSTPLRIVFNSSAMFQGHCLNDYWMKGPDLLNNLFGVMLRFRENETAVIGDISKMYHRILIPERDQHVHRFLWRDLDVSKKPEVYVKTVLTFGDKPAPAMAQTALKRTAEEGEKLYPEAARTLKENTYMDDICDSVHTVNQAQKLTKQVDTVLAEGGFKVKGWVSNKSLNEETPDSDRVERKLLPNEAEEKVLGTVWEPEEDVLSFKVTMNLDRYVANRGESDNLKLTKRRVLSQVARIFDPIGFATAFLIRAKIGMQHLWLQGIDWDQELSQQMQHQWMKLFQEMTDLNNVSFSRCLTPADATGDPILCIFSDASEEAFGACAYFRWQLIDGTYDVRFIAAKSRVAPLKKLTTPRLELQAAVIASRLYKTITEQTRFQISKPIFLTDSSIVLAWIQKPARRFKPFVSNRVGEIQSTTDPSHWRHVPGEFNVADDVSRGISVKQLTERWQHGPEFLYSPESEWPQDVSCPDQTELDKEERKTQQILVTQESPEILDCTRFSSWMRLIRVTAYVLRFIDNLRDKQQNRAPMKQGPLSPNELKDAETYWITRAQRSLHERLAAGEFKTLSPFTDEGIIRVGGRVNASFMSYETSHPALLPNRHHVSLLIMQHMHQFGHTGIAATVAKARRKYWILKAHRLAKTIKFRCVFCRERDKKTETQFMGDLPQQRLAPYTPPFYYTACDYFGPYKVRISRNKTTKHYGVIFTCLNTRAVHLELAVDYSTMEFMQVLRRFFAIRGYPAMMTSDNGSQLVGAEQELRRIVQGWDKEKLQEFCADKGMKWKFTTPAAPHQNGCAESLVKTCKAALKQSVGEQVLTPFELYTVLLEVANLVNQRPIGRIPNDPDDGAYLCPNDILLGRASTAIPQGPFRETKNPRHRVEFVQKIIDSFWKRWSRDVLPHLVPRRKWKVERRNVQVNDIVILSDSNAIRDKWHIGRILEVYPGQDGKVRNVQVKTATGIYKRPVTKIAVIYPSEGY